MARNMQVLLASRPTGWVEESNFKIVETDVPKPGPGEVLVKNLWLSLDPYMRGRMNAAKSYAKYVEIGEVMTGGTVGQVVESGSAATGAVGGVVGQLAKLQGCRAVGIAGGPKKCEFAVKELGFDACVDYKAGKLLDDLKAACPNGVDNYFENVGGEVLDAAFKVLNPFSRVALCGLIAEYNATEPYGVKMMRSLLVNRVKLQGFIVFDRVDLYQRAIPKLANLVSQGKIKYHETIAEGLQNAPKAFIGLLKGQNLGKQLVKLA